MEKKVNIPKVFIGFLISSFLIWVFINLSKKYSTVVTYAVEFDKLAQNRILQEEPIKELKLLIKGTGFKLLSSGFSSRSIKLSANKLVKKYASSYYFLTVNQKADIQKQLTAGLLLQDVLKDTIYLKLGSLQTKKVPVVPNLSVKYKVGYDAAEEITVMPDSILISGPELQIQDIKNIQLAKLELNQVSENIAETIPILFPESDKIKTNVNAVNVKITVDKFTEGEFEIPVVVENILPEKKLNIFPKKAKVIFKIGLKNFSKVTADSFEVVCDYKETKKEGLNYLIPKLKSKPLYVSSVRIVPEKIDFLIYK